MARLEKDKQHCEDRFSSIVIVFVDEGLDQFVDLSGRSIQGVGYP